MQHVNYAVYMTKTFIDKGKNRRSGSGVRCLCQGKLCRLGSDNRALFMSCVKAHEFMKEYVDVTQKNAPGV